MPTSFRSSSTLRLRCLAADALVQEDRLADLVADGHDRVERAHRLLEDHGDVAAADIRHARARQAQKVDALEHDAPAHDAAGRLGDKPQDRQRRDRLCRNRIRRRCRRPPGCDLEADAVDGADGAALRAELDRKILDREERRRHHAVSGSSTSRTASPSTLKASTTTVMAKPAPMIGQGEPKMLPSAVADDVAPARVRRLRADAEEAQRRFEADGRGDPERHQHDDRRGDVGQDMPQDDLRRAQADGDGRLDVGLLLDGERRGAGDAGKARHEGDGDDHDDVPEAAAERRRDHDREQEFGKGEQEVDDPRHDAVDEAAEIAGGDAERGAEDGGERRRDEAEDQRIAGAVEKARKHVAAELVGAEPMLRRRIGVDAKIALGERIVGRDRRRCERDRDEERDDARRHEGGWALRREQALQRRKARLLRREALARVEGDAHAFARMRGSTTM